MRSRSPLWYIQPCRRTTATTMYRTSYSKPLLASTLLKKKGRSWRGEKLTSTFKLLGYYHVMKTGAFAILARLCYGSFT